MSANRRNNRSSTFGRQQGTVECAGVSRTGIRGTDRSRGLHPSALLSRASDIVESGAGGFNRNASTHVAEFTGLPDIMNGYHEPEQRYCGDCGQRTAAINTLYSSSQPAAAWRIIHRYGVRYIFVGWFETHCTIDPSTNRTITCYPKNGLAKFGRMVGHGLRVAYRRDGVTIYEVIR